MLLRDVAAKFLDLEVVEALMHQKVNSDYFVELVDSQSANCLEYPEEDHAKDARPGNYDQRAEALYLEHVKATSVY